MALANLAANAHRAGQVINPSHLRAFYDTYNSYSAKVILIKLSSTLYSLFILRKFKYKERKEHAQRETGV